jgi:hypothetical protein
MFMVVLRLGKWVSLLLSFSSFTGRLAQVFQVFMDRLLVVGSKILQCPQRRKPPLDLS